MTLKKMAFLHGKIEKPVRHRFSKVSFNSLKGELLCAMPSLALIGFYFVAKETFLASLEIFRAAVLA